ncbi:MAG: PIN domain-containing protein [Bacteroidales bacterium]|nr:PIN domain-containing protein [Bacteroidales bacterium]
MFNEEILAEYKDVLNRPKFKFPSSLVKAVLDAITSIGLYMDRTESGELFPDPKDAVFYEVALSKEDSFLVTGNIKHFPKSPIVVTPAEMLEILFRSK